MYKKWFSRLNIYSSRRLKERFFKTINQQLFEMKEKPHRVALGCVLGISINFIPTLGVGFLLAFLLARMFRINPACAVITSLVTGPLVPLMYAFNFLVGSSIFASSMGMDSFTEFILKQYALILKVSSFREQIINFLGLFGLTFMVGAVVNAVIFGFATYVIVSLLLKKIIIKYYEN